MFDREDLKLTKELQEKTSQEITCMVIKNIVLSHAAATRGLNEEERRLFYKICDVFDKAIEGKAEEVELEDNYFGFIKKCKRETSLMPDKILQAVEKLIDEVKDR